MTSTLYRAGGLRGQRGTALLVTDDVITWLGEEVDCPPAQRVVDLADCWLAPAFVDAHVHVTSTGLALTGLDLTGCPSLEEGLRRLADQARRLRGGVVLGTGWDETSWPEGRPPTARELDRASHGGVVYLARTDVHSAVASSALLAAVPGVTGMDGFLGDGLVRQQAHHAVRRTALESVTSSQRRAAQLAALDRMASLGIGCVHECGGPDISGEVDFRALLDLDHPVERIGYWGELGAIERARDLGAAGAAGDLFVDGALGSRSACLAAPYVDHEGTGHSYLDLGQVTEHIRDCTTAGLQAGFHAIGDAALDAVTGGFEAVARELGREVVHRAAHRVEHAEMLTPRHIAILAACGVTASVQPAFDARWGGREGMYAQRLGQQRALAMNPFAAMVDAGVVLALGSDSPVTPPDPWGGIRAAVEHRTPGSGLSLDQAFEAHTTGGWLAAGRDGGVLRVGGAATFAAWEGPEPTADRSDPTCRMTVVRGRVAFG